MDSSSCIHEGIYIKSMIKVQLKPIYSYTPPRAQSKIVYCIKYGPQTVKHILLSQCSSSPAFYDNFKEFLLSSYGICVYLAVERSYCIYLNVNIAFP